MNSERMVIPVPYKGTNYEIHINHVLKPVVGYHCSIYKNGKNVLAIKGVLGSIEDCKREGSKMIVMDYNNKSSADASPDANLATGQDTSPYAKGTVKLTWVDKNDNKILHSQMFDSVEEALKNSYEKRHWLIFKLKQSASDTYNWELLPYGYNKSYTRSLFISEKPLLKLFLFGLAATGAYFIGKAIYDKLKDNSLPPIGSSPLPTPLPTPSPVTLPK